jgi:hypothetical protein
MTTDGAADLQRWRALPVMRLLGTGALLAGNHQNKVWRGMAQVPNSHEPGVPMIVKWVPKNETLAAELACSLAARALKLQIPPGFLILAEKADLPGLPNRVVGEANHLVICYGSELQWPDDTLMRPNDSDAAQDYVWRKICETTQGPIGGVWDELVVNDDRHHENVVWDGQRWWLIDHEYSLPSVAKAMKKFTDQILRQGVIDDVAKQNTLVIETMRRRPVDHKMEALPLSWQGYRQRLNWLADQARQWRTGLSPVDTVLMMTEFYLRGIDLRLPALALHLHQRMSKPTTSSLWNSTIPKRRSNRKTLPRPPA